MNNDDQLLFSACQLSEFIYSAGNVTDRFLNLTYTGIQFGWLNAYQNGKQYVLPAYDDVDDVYEECLGINKLYIGHYFLRERMSLDIPENIPVKYTLCYVYKQNIYNWITINILTGNIITQSMVVVTFMQENVMGKYSLIYHIFAIITNYVSFIKNNAKVIAGKNNTEKTESVMTEL